MHVRSDSVNVLNIPSTSTVWSPPRSSISGKGLDKYYRAIIVEDSAYQVVHCTDLGAGGTLAWNLGPMRDAVRGKMRSSGSIIALQ